MVIRQKVSVSPVGEGLFKTGVVGSFFRLKTTPYAAVIYEVRSIVKAIHLSFLVFPRQDRSIEFVPIRAKAPRVIPAAPALMVRAAAAYVLLTFLSC
jgi:hypothetical protein